MYYTMPFCTTYYMWYYLEICCVILCLYMSPAWNKIKAMFPSPRPSLSVGSAAPASRWVPCPWYRVNKYLLHEWMTPNSDTHLGRVTNLAGDCCCWCSRMALPSSSGCDHLDHKRPWLFHSSVLWQVHTCWSVIEHWASLVAQTVKNLLTMQETWVLFLGWEDPLEKGLATHSSIPAWRISWPEESLITVHEFAKRWTWLSD